MIKRLLALFAVLVAAFVFTGSVNAVASPATGEWNVHYVCKSNLAVPYGLHYDYGGHRHYYYHAMCGGSRPWAPDPEDDAEKVLFGNIPSHTVLFVETWCPNPSSKAWTTVDIYKSNKDGLQHDPGQTGPHVAHRGSGAYRRLWSTSIPLKANTWRLAVIIKNPQDRDGPHCHSWTSFSYDTLLIVSPQKYASLGTPR